ncbi:hypothetical protein [Pseudomonas serbica]|uniref:hypothetical protein n=1 Tax=Pseudomonas serbica TaxID=2965074 RepID=UPI00237C436B|nr:hypothetical protein [Pseudomonas serbica]
MIKIRHLLGAVVALACLHTVAMRVANAHDKSAEMESFCTQTSNKQIQQSPTCVNTAGGHH